MKGWKGFNPDFTCKGKQYKENAIFEEDKAEVCNCGMHFCDNPFNVLNYYELVNGNGEINEFAEVEALSEPITDDQEKYCTKKLKIGVKLGLKGFVKACVGFAIEKTNFEFPSDKLDSGNSAQIGSSGYYAQIGSSGYYAQIGSSGYYAKIGSSGDSAQIGSSGNYAIRELCTDWKLRLLCTDWKLRLLCTDWKLRLLCKDWKLRGLCTDWKLRELCKD